MPVGNGKRLNVTIRNSRVDNLFPKFAALGESGVGSVAMELRLLLSRRPAQAGFTELAFQKENTATSERAGSLKPLAQSGLLIGT